MCIIFGQRLKQLRKERHLTQYEVASCLSYGSSAISNYETGKNEPSLNDLVRLADYFEVSIDYLLDRKCCKESVFLKEFIYFYNSLSYVQKKYIQNIFNLKILKKLFYKDNNKENIAN